MSTSHNKNIKGAAYAAEINGSTLARLNVYAGVMPVDPDADLTSFTILEDDIAIAASYLNGTLTITGSAGVWDASGVAGFVTITCDGNRLFISDSITVTGSAVAGNPVSLVSCTVDVR